MSDLSLPEAVLSRTPCLQSPGTPTPIPPDLSPEIQTHVITSPSASPSVCLTGTSNCPNYLPISLLLHPHLVIGTGRSCKLETPPKLSLPICGSPPNVPPFPSAHPWPAASLTCVSAAVLLHAVCPLTLLTKELSKT